MPLGHGKSFSRSPEEEWEECVGWAKRHVHFFLLFHAVNQTRGTNCREKGWGPEMEGDKHPVAHPLCDKAASRIWDYLTSWWFTHQPPWQGPLRSSISYVRTSLWPYLCLEFFLSVQISAAFVKQPPSAPPWVDHIDFRAPPSSISPLQQGLASLLCPQWVSLTWLG